MGLSLSTGEIKEEEPTRRRKHWPFRISCTWAKEASRIPAAMMLSESITKLQSPPPTSPVVKGLQNDRPRWHQNSAIHLLIAVSPGSEFSSASWEKRQDGIWEVTWHWKKVSRSDGSWCTVCNPRTPCTWPSCHRKSYNPHVGIKWIWVRICKQLWVGSCCWPSIIAGKRNTDDSRIVCKDFLEASVSGVVKSRKLSQVVKRKHWPLSNSLVVPLSPELVGSNPWMTHLLQLWVGLPKAKDRERRQVAGNVSYLR